MNLMRIALGFLLITQAMDLLMKSLYLPIILFAMIFTKTASADEQAEIEAGKLLDIMQMQKTMDAAIPIVVDAMLKVNPKIVPLKGVILDFMSKYMSYETLKPSYVELYTTMFTTTELIELTAFYSTPTGKKLISKQAYIFEQGSQLGKNNVQKHMPELEKMLQEEIVRIQLQQEQNV